MICFFRPVLAALVTLALVFPGTSEAKAIPANPFTLTYDYDAFGVLLHSTGSTPNNYLYSGEQFDPDLGLYYNRARYLSVTTGRFWTMDTDEGNDNEPVSLHKYFYAEGEPIDGVDPTGNDDLATITAGFSISETLDALPQVQPTKPSFEKCWLTGFECTRNKVIFAAIEEAWADSNYASLPVIRHEHGGWIYQANKKGDDTIKVLSAPTGKYRTIDLRNPPQMVGFSVIANYHTHPNPSFEGFRARESDADLGLQIKYNVPGLLRSEEGMSWYGPIRRGASPQLAAPGPVDGYPGDKSDTRYCD